MVQHNQPMDKKWLSVKSICSFLNFTWWEEKSIQLTLTIDWLWKLNYREWLFSNNRLCQWDQHRSACIHKQLLLCTNEVKGTQWSFMFVGFQKQSGVISVIVFHYEIIPVRFINNGSTMFVACGVCLPPNWIWNRYSTCESFSVTINDYIIIIQQTNNFTFIAFDSLQSRLANV